MLGSTKDLSGSVKPMLNSLVSSIREADFLRPDFYDESDADVS